MQFDVPLIPQTTNMSCWAASIAMILGWKHHATYDPKRIAANNGGPSYMPSFIENGSGLDPNDRYILERNGFLLDAPQCYSLRSIQQLIDAHGPLWAASLSPLPHIRVITGYDGQMLKINDPSPVGHGSRYISSFSAFFAKMEELGEKEGIQAGSNKPIEPNPVYIAYLA